MPHLSPMQVLMVVAAVMAALVVKDWFQHRRVTPAVKARLLIVIIFTVVVAWQNRPW